MTVVDTPTFPIDSETYNSPTGKIVPAGSYSVQLYGTITSSGDVNTQDGLIFSSGLTARGFGNYTTWNSLKIANANVLPTYIKFTPTSTLPSGGCMIAINAEFEGATSDVYNGTGEVAVYGRFSEDESDIRPLMYMGKVGATQFKTGGWMIPGDAYSASFITHYRDIFSELSWLSGKSWADVKDIRLVATTSLTGKKVKIKDFRVYENVVDSPYGTASFVSASVDSITINVDLHGGLASSGATAPLRIKSVTLDSPTNSASIEEDMAAATSVSREETFSTLEDKTRLRYITLADYYGNLGYIGDVFGTHTTQVGNVTIDVNEVTGEAEISCELPGTGKLLYCAFYAKRDGDATWRAFDVVRFVGNTQTLPYTANAVYPLEGGLDNVDLKVGAYTMADILDPPNLDPQTYYFGYESTGETVAYAIPPSLVVVATSAEGKVVATASASDANGIKNISIYEVNGEVETLLKSSNQAEPYPITAHDNYTFDSVVGNTVTIRAKATDGSDQSNQADTSTLVVAGGDIPYGEYSITPQVSVLVTGDGKVTLSWTDWNNFMPAVGELRFPPDRFSIYRKPQAGGYSLICDNLPDWTRDYIDSSLTTPDIYTYSIVGTDQFGNRKSIEVIVDLVNLTASTRFSFIENYLQTLPKWTAAVPKQR